jgi:hypothetical protein
MTIVIGGSLNQILFVVLPLHFDPGFRGLFFGNKNMRKKEPEDFDDKMFFFTIAMIGMVGCIIIALITQYL